jgi:hypothetical protein
MLLVAFIGPLFRMLGELNGLAHLLLWPAIFAAVFTAGYVWRHWGHNWLGFTVPAGAPPVAVRAPMAMATGLPLPDAHHDGAVPPADALDQLAAAAVAVQAQLSHDEAAAKAELAAADAKAKADTAALDAKRAKLATVAASLAGTKPVV